ncbi:uncharacterized protein LOC134748564 isoform X2 [Cydia strobilella]|uniref:uncharacterized protein LOC134748564 isoform X2 n=1 Tax=Cydia strobilella TaxID=1100964 RepID=UPI003007DBB9
MEKGGSKLMQMQARFQQKQMQERELKIASLYEAQQARALTRVRHSPSESLVRRSPSESLSSPPQPPVTHQPGKVRQMFEERRTKGIDKSYPLQPIQNTERSRKPLPNGFAKVSSTRAQNGTERTEHRQNGTKTSSRVSEKKSVAHTSISSQSMKKHHVKTEEVIDRSGDLNHNHQPDLNAVKEALISNGLVHEVDELDGDGNMLEDETFPETLAPVTPRDEPPARPPRRSPMTKTTPSTTTKPKPAAAPAAPPRRTPSGNASESKSQGSMANRGPKPATVGSSTIKSTPRSSLQVKRVPAAQSSTGAGVPCSVCGRRFAEDRLAKHEDICRRAQTKKRKPFDALKHRLAGTEAEPFISKLRKSNTSNAAPAKPKPLNSSWRKKHEEFIQAIRAAKQVQQHLAAGGKLSDLPPPPPSENPDYVQCPHCSRRFNQAAAERHIPKCASFQFNKPKPGQGKPSNSKRR